MIDGNGKPEESPARGAQLVFVAQVLLRQSVIVGPNTASFEIHTLSRALPSEVAIAALETLHQSIGATLERTKLQVAKAALAATGPK
jgi:hypothetical protein